MFHVVLYEPEIPPNTGNVIRLCANSGTRLHLIRPLGFRLEDRELKRAGLDYHEYATVLVHETWSACQTALSAHRTFAFSTRATRRFTDTTFAAGDVFVFGPETRGLPAAVLAGFAPERQLRVPMLPVNRSINLSNAVAIVVYEAWRQNGFAGGT
jgi:tRNA (cytidine/uridine-2'-O-)-methyltransferase